MQYDTNFFERYTQQTLSQDEKESFEKALQEDEALQQIFKLHLLLKQTVPDFHERQTLKKKLQARTLQPKRVDWLAPTAIAASVLVCMLAAWYVFFFEQGNDKVAIQPIKQTDSTTADYAQKLVSPVDSAAALPYYQLLDVPISYSREQGMGYVETPTKTSAFNINFHPNDSAVYRFDGKQLYLSAPYPPEQIVYYQPAGAEATWYVAIKKQYYPLRIADTVQKLRKETNPLIIEDLSK